MLYSHNKCRQRKKHKRQRDHQNEIKSYKKDTSSKHRGRKVTVKKSKVKLGYIIVRSKA